jgi:hypothetical protein
MELSQGTCPCNSSPECPPCVLAKTIQKIHDQAEKNVCRLINKLNILLKMFMNNMKIYVFLFKNKMITIIANDDYNLF